MRDSWLFHLSYQSRATLPDRLRKLKQLSFAFSASMISKGQYALTFH